MTQTETSSGSNTNSNPNMSNQQPYSPPAGEAYPPQAYPPQAYPPTQTYSNQPYPPPAGEQSYPPQAYANQPYPPQAYPPQQYAPQPNQLYPPQPYPPHYAPQPNQPYPPQSFPGSPPPPQVVYGAPQVVAMGVAAPAAPLPQNVRFREIPVLIKCPYCNVESATRLSYTNGMLTWLSFGGLCLFGCWLGCCCIPFCVDGLKDVEHHCSACQRVVGVHRRID